MDHASEARGAQISRFRQMTPGERWSAARDLYWSVRRLKEAFIRQQHPHWSNDQVAAALKPRDTARIGELFPLEEFYCPPEEIIVQEVLRAQRGHFNLIHHESGFKTSPRPAPG